MLSARSMLFFLLFSASNFWLHFGGHHFDIVLLSVAIMRRREQMRALQLNLSHFEICRELIKVQHHISRVARGQMKWMGWMGWVYVYLYWYIQYVYTVRAKEQRRGGGTLKFYFTADNKIYSFMGFTSTPVWQRKIAHLSATATTKKSREWAWKAAEDSRRAPCNSFTDW